MKRAAPESAGEPALAIICGAGGLPFAVADAAIRRGRRVVLFALIGFADPKQVAAYPHTWGRMGQANWFIRHATREGCRDMLFIGSVRRPSLWQLRPDLRGLWLLPRILRLYWGGDDRMLTGAAAMLEEYGFRLVGLQEVAPELLMPEGPLGAFAPAEPDCADIERGLALLRANSPFDIGQAVVVANNQVLAVEGPEGTDAMLARVGELRRTGRIRTPAERGVLVKAAKVGQNLRLDLPTIGPQTVEGASAARLAGIAVMAGTTIAAEAANIAAAADRAKLFVVGIRPDEAMR
jgi:DUF1009 family protein